MNWFTRWWVQYRLLRELDKVETELRAADSHARRIGAMIL
jgi:hypothetical protein